MRKFKKILAAALAAVLALTMLAGCSSGAFNKSEFIKQVGDYDGITYKDVGESQAAAVGDALQKTNPLFLENYKDPAYSPIYTSFSNQLSHLAHYQTNPPADDFYQQLSEIQKELFKKLEVDPDGFDLCYLSIAALDDFSSAHYKNSLENVLAAKVLQDRQHYCMNSNTDTDAISSFSNQGTVSLKTITLDGKQYLIGVWKVAE